MFGGGKEDTKRPPKNNLCRIVHSFATPVFLAYLTSQAMSLSRVEILIEKLISNKLSGEELSELLAGITSEEQQREYSEVLEAYFNQLLKEEQKQEK